MKIIPIALGLFAAVLVFGSSAQAAGANAETCRAAIQSKKPCVGTIPNTTNRTACFRAAMQRCKENGPGAI
jgi:hypothetical protein